MLIVCYKISLTSYFFFRQRVSESSESTTMSNSSMTPEVPMSSFSSNNNGGKIQNIQNPDQDPDIDDQEVLAESPTWRGILRKSDSKINLND